MVKVVRMDKWKWTQVIEEGWERIGRVSTTEYGMTSIYLEFSRHPNGTFYQDNRQITVPTESLQEVSSRNKASVNYAYWSSIKPPKLGDRKCQ